jgi:hypothetical protein
MQPNQFQVGAVADAFDHLGADVSGGYLKDTYGSIHSIEPFGCQLISVAAERSSAALPPRPSG